MRAGEFIPVAPASAQARCAPAGRTLSQPRCVAKPLIWLIRYRALTLSAAD